MVKSYRDLLVWQKSKQAVKEVYLLTAAFPKEEMYGLTSQIRRSSVSVPSNIAEGHARKSTKEFSHFISIALGSLAELETQIEIASDLSFIEYNKLQIIMNSLDEIGKMLRGLQNSLTTNP